jgi:hypothetical protein
MTHKLFLWTIEVRPKERFKVRQTIEWSIQIMVKSPSLKATSQAIALAAAVVSD